MTRAPSETARRIEAALTHAPAAALTVELQRLRNQAHRLASTYPPTPGRAAMLRENELAQRAVRAKLRGFLGERLVFGGARGSPAPGAIQPAWGQRW